jgi:phosphate-selective porin OprO/OprP
LELAARYGALNIDDATFELGFSDRARWASAAKEWGLAVNWHLARGNKLCLNYENIHFTDGAPGGNNRPTEAAILARFQAYF